MTECPPTLWLLLAVWLSLSFFPLKAAPPPPLSSPTLILELSILPIFPNILPFIMPAGSVLVAG